MTWSYFVSGHGMLLVASVRRIRYMVCVAAHLYRRSFSNKSLDSVKMTSAGTSNGQPTVGIIIIGDEILKGQTRDTNSHFLVRRLFTLGARVRKISVIPDDLDVIANEVCTLDLGHVKIM